MAVPTIVAERHPDAGTIRLTFGVGLSVLDSMLNRVVRVDVTGLTPVRTLPGQLPALADRQGSVVILEDHEYPLGSELTYRAYFHPIGSPDGHEAMVSTTVPAESIRPAKAWLGVPQRPVYDAPIELVTGYEANRAPQTTIHEIIGRADPIATPGVLATRRGTISYWCKDYTEVTKIMHVYSLGKVALLRPPAEPETMVYHVATDEIKAAPAQLEQGYPIRWRVDVPYTEVARPGGPLSGSTLWTFDQVADKYHSMDELVDLYQDFDALTVGIENA